MRKIYNVLCKIEGLMLKVLFSAMTIVVWMQVFNKMTINAQMAWSEELSRYLFAWLVFIAAAYASGEKAHIGVTALVDHLPKAAARVAEIICYVLCAVFSVALIYYTVNIMAVQISYGQRSPSLQLPMQVAYAGMVIGGVFILFHYVIHICNFFRRENEETEGREEA